MREILTALAVLLIAVLTAALVGPYFVDWTSHRTAIEARLSQALGTYVGIEGPITVRLLPRPVLTAERVRAGLDSNGDHILAAARVRLELAPLALLRGELDFIEAALDRPDLRLMRRGGRLVLPHLAGSGGLKARLERLRLTGGRIISPSPGQPDLIYGPVSLSGSAVSLAGPFRAEGTVDLGGGPAGFRLSTGAYEAGRIRLRLAIDEARPLPAADFDGILGLASGETGLEPVFEGGLTLEGALGAVTGQEGAPLGWRISGPLKASRQEARMESLDLRLGFARGAPVATGIAMNGQLTAALQDPPRVGLVLRSPQLDFDRLLAAEPGGRAAPLMLGQLLVERLRAEAVPAIPADISLTLEPTPVTIGGETVGDFSAALVLSPGQRPHLTVATGMPGRSRLSVEGHVETGSAPRLTGRIEADSGDAPRLRDWLAGGLAAPPAWLAAAPPFRSMELSGEMDVSAAGFRLSSGRLALDRSRLAGGFSYTAPVASERARLFADLTAEALDLDGVPDLSGLFQRGAPVDLNLALDARAVRLARVGTGLLESGRIVVRMTRDAQATVLERLSVTGLGGANVTGQGRLDASGSQLQLDLDASRLGELADLTARLFPSPASQLFQRRAPRLSPARLGLRMEGAGPQMASALTLSGTAGGTRITARAALKDALPESLEGTAEAGQAGDLLRQLGLEAIPLQGTGPGRLTARFGLTGGRVAGALTASLAGTTLAYEGALDPAPLAAGGAPLLEGRVTLDGSNAAPLLQVLGLMTPDPQASVRAALRANIRSVPAQLHVTGIEGEAFGSPVSGDLTVRLDESPERPLVGGRLHFAQLHADGLFSLILGAPQPIRRGGAWSDLAFAAALANIPSAQIDLSAGRLSLGAPFGPPLDIADATVSLELRPGVMGLDAIRLPFAPGFAGGNLTLRRAGQDAAISGRIDLSGLRLEGAMKGALSGTVDFAGSGRNAAALAASLGGSGSAQIEGLTVEGVSPDAMARVIAGVDADRIDVSRDSVARALAAELGRAGLRLERAAMPAALAAGVLRLGPHVHSAAPFRTTLQAQLDFKSMQVEWRAGVTDTRLPQLWTGSPPSLEVIWRGPAEAPRRDIDSGLFFNGLAARQIVREMEKIEALEADIRERAFFNRRLRSDQFLRRRDQEIRVFEIEQARLAAEAEKKRLEEEARRAEAERRQEEIRRREEARRQAEEERAQRVEEERARREAEQILRRAPGPPAPVPVQAAPPAPVPLAPSAPFPAPAGPVPNVRDPSAAGRY